MVDPEEKPEDVARFEDVRASLLSALEEDDDPATRHLGDMGAAYLAGWLARHYFKADIRIEHEHLEAYLAANPKLKAQLDKMLEDTDDFDMGDDPDFGEA